jgi:hypothetical protein
MSILIYMYICTYVHTSRRPTLFNPFALALQSAKLIKIHTNIVCFPTTSKMNISNVQTYKGKYSSGSGLHHVLGIQITHAMFQTCTMYLHIQITECNALLPAITRTCNDQAGALPIAAKHRWFHFSAQVPVACPLHFRSAVEYLVVRMYVYMYVFDMCVWFWMYFLSLE